MSSTSISKNILEIADLDITYKTSLFHGRGLRDAFIEAISSPLKFLMRRPNNLELLKNINLSIKNGDRVGLLGINGCGKTSLCRAIAGMHGKQNCIKVNGSIRAIFDTSVIIQPELSGQENATILVNLMYPELDKKQREEIVNESIDFSELGEFKYSAFKYYSKGMKARLFLSIISARPCDLLILDEVYNGADTFFNEKITKRIKSIIESSNAVLFVSHSNETIKEVCNRVCVIKNKKIAFDGNTEEGINYYLKNCSNEN